VLYFFSPAEVSSSVHLSAAEAFPTTASAIALANKIDFNMLHLSFLVFGLIAAHTAPHPARHCGRSRQARRLGND
jgi:hypothetical protein